jgi:hypothetical protein
MSIDSNAELRSFGAYIAELIESGKEVVSPEDALARWRMQNLSPEEFDEEVAAIREALDDMEAGDKGRPMEEFLAEVDAQYGFKPRK